MKTEYKDKNGNLPEVGGTLMNEDHDDVLKIRAVLDAIIITDDGNNDKDCLILYIPKLIEEGYTFEPKPQEPKKETPPKGIPVWIILDGEKKSVRVSSGKTNDHGELLCYDRGHAHGSSTAWADERWELI